MMIPYGYKQTEVGVIPEDWELLLLGKTAKVYRGGSPRPIQSYITNSSNGVNWIKIGDVRENDKYIYSTQEKIRPDGISMSREVHIGDFILSNSMSFGRPYILRTNGCIHDGWLTIQEYGQAFSTEYLYYLLSSKIIYKQYIGMAAGSSVKNLNKDKVSSLMVICPPLPEQRRIAEALSDVDGMISSLEKLVAKYKSIKTACLQQMFPQNGETVPRMRLPGFTGAWEQRKLGDIADIVGGGTPSTGNQSYWDGDIDWYAPAEIADQIYANSSQKKITGLGYENSSAKMLPPGTVLFTSRAGIGKTAILTRKGCTNQGFQSIVPHRGELDSYFIFSRTEELKRYGELVGAGSTFVEVSGKQMAVMELMMPPTMREQQTIGDFFQQLDHLITLHQRKLEKVQKIKQGMMQQLLTGKIRLV